MDAIERHERVALQFSGGRDSLACLYLLRPHWDRLTVYWLNTGDAFPETVALADKVKRMVPRFVEVRGYQPEALAAHGLPTDILPAMATPIGVHVHGGGVPMQDRYSCCARSIMEPMALRMARDQITLVIRGQKNADDLKSRVRSGDVVDGVEYLMPIQDWTGAGVMSYLRAQGAPIPRFYEMLDSAPDCMTCSAYWEHGVAKYLKRYHHRHFEVVQDRLDTINKAVAGSIAHFNTEINS